MFSNNKKNSLILVGVILVTAIFFRVYEIDVLPLGLNVDEVSQGYNANSLLQTGRDRYGKFLPILFKSYESFQPPLYTYLTIMPTFIFGKGNFSVRLVSVVSHLVVIFLTFLIVRKIFPKNKRFSFLSSFAVAISPWSIFFSRYATEASLGLVLMLGAIYFFLVTEERKTNLVIALLLLGLSTHAYYTERLVAPLLLLIFLGVYRKFIFKNLKIFLVGVFFYGLLMVPHLFMMKEGAFFRRFDQVTYLSAAAFERNGGAYKEHFFGRLGFTLNEFLSQYLAYYSPKNLFFLPDSQGGRSMPDLSVFYSWMILPLLLGVATLIRRPFSQKEKFLALVMLVSVVPAALSTDPFYTLRVFLFLWFVSVFIGYGLDRFYLLVNKRRKWILVFLVLISLSLFDFYRKYFVLFKHERVSNFGGLDKIVADYIAPFDDKEVLIDLSERDISTGLRMAYYLNFSPERFQSEIGWAYLDTYYSSYEVEKQYLLDNVQVRPIVWEKDVYKDQIIVGDNISISDEQVQEHKLTLLYKFSNLDGGRSIRIFSTNPKEKCKDLTNKGNEMCLVNFR